MTRDEQIAAFIAARGVTRCAPTSSHAENAPSLRAMRLAREHVAGEPEPSVEQRAELYAERFAGARAAGLSVSDALDEARDA